MKEILLLITAAIAVTFFVLFIIFWDKNRRKWQLIHSIGHDIGKTLNLETVFNEISRVLRPVIPFDIFGIALVRMQKGELHYKYIRDKLHGSEKSIHIPIISEESLEAWCYLNDDELRLRKELHHSHKPYTKDFVTLNRRQRVPLSALYVPVRDLSGTVAVLTLQHRSHKYKRRELMLLKDVSPFFGVFIRNTLHKLDLEKMVKKRTRELQNTITQLENTQEQLITSEKLASLGKLVAGVAHEINTPVGSSLTGITSVSSKAKKLMSLYNEGDLSQEDLEELLEEIIDTSRLVEGELHRASQLIRSFKQVSADRSSEIRRNFKLKTYIDDIILSMNNTLKKRDIDIQLNCPDEIFLDSYPGAISQLFNNLIMNSLIHAFPEGNSNGTITIEVKGSPDTVNIVFSDTGVGITSKDLKQIFEPFFSTAHNRGGTGLGLNIVHNIVTNSLQGSITCRSTPNQGTSFDIKLPYTISNEES